MSELLSQDELLSITGLRQKAALRRHLRKSRIPFHETNGKIWTTLDAINSPLIGKNKKVTEPKLDALTAKGTG